MSVEQRQLRLWLQHTSDVSGRCELKRERNTIMYALRCKARNKARLINLASDVKRLHDGAKMFRADVGHGINNAVELNARFTEHIGHQFNDPTLESLPAFAGRLSRLQDPIPVDEAKRAISKLNRGLAIFRLYNIAGIFSDALKRQKPLELDKDVLISLHKPGKSFGTFTSVRLINYNRHSERSCHSSFCRESRLMLNATCRRCNRDSDADVARST